MVAWARRLFASAVITSALASTAGAQVATPIPTPDGDTSFIGSVRVTYPLLSNALKGRIFYTLDGSIPDQNDKEYTEALTITSNCVLTGRRLRNGDWSQPHASPFFKKKLPKPVLAWEGKSEFTGTKKVTITSELTSAYPTGGRAPVIRYTTDGGYPDSIYTSALNLGRTSIVRAVATHPDYDTSLASEQTFTMLVPVDKPSVNPKGKEFTTSTLGVAFSTTTTGTVFFMYSFGAGTNPEAGTNIGNTAVITGGNAGDTVVLNVVAKKDGMATSAITTEKYVYKPAAAAPLPFPVPPYTFLDTVTVSLSSATAGAEIYYTTDGKVPTQSTSRYSDAQKIRLDSTTQLRAVAFKSGFGLSEIYSGPYTLTLSNPTPSVGSSEFQDSIKFTLNAKNPTADIFYTLDGTDPTTKSHHYNRDPSARDTIKLEADSTELRVIAIKGLVKSPVKSYVYAKSNKLRFTLPPVIEPASQDFLDTIPVTLSVSDPLATIWYTLEGGPRTQYTKGKPIVIRSSSTLKAQATRPDRDPSEERIEEYVQLPATPKATPEAGAPVPNRLEVRLSTKTPGAEIRYLLGKQNFSVGVSTPYANTPLVFNSNTYLQAVAISGTGSRNRMSQVMVQEYSVYVASIGDTVPPGQERDLSWGMAVANKGASALLTKLIPFDQLNLKGFIEATHAVTISAGPGQPVPNARITRPDGQLQALYSLDLATGKATLVGNVFPQEINKAGTYFAAIDTMAPQISIAAVETKANLGATVKLHILDNVAKPACEVRGSGILDKLALEADTDGFLTFSLKNGENEVKNLWFQAQAKDVRNTGLFPPTGGTYYLSQAWSKLTVANAWSLGLNADQPYDLAGLPIGTEATLTWAQIKRDNPDPALTAFTYRDGLRVQLQDGDVMKPGIAFWLGSKNARSSLILSKFHTAASQIDGRFRVRLQPGWNMVTNPSFGTLHWPSPRTDANYSTKQVRGLWGYDTRIMDFAKSDSLLPWRGYLVMNYLGRDTTVELLASPKALAKAAADNDPGKIEILLDHGRPFPLRLGARGYAQDAVGVEDEPLLPYWNHLRQGWSARGKNRLMTDVLHFNPDQILRWKVVLEGKPVAGRDSMVTVSESRLPAGFEAWAYSRRRNLKVRLLPGAGYSLPGPEADTVEVLAGPAAKLALLGELTHAVEGVDAFQGRIRPGKNGPGLFLALPTDARVRAEIWSLAGRRSHVLQDGRLGYGQHFLPLPDGGRNPDARLLRIRAEGDGWARNQVLKLPR